MNDEPSFAGGGDVSVFRGDGGYDAAWASVLDEGAVNESSQSLSFNITGNDNSGLFAAGPAIDGSTGNLSFTPAANANGTANITVELMDDGGTSDGGDDTSSSVTFAINVTGTLVYVDGNPSLNGDTITVPINLDGTGDENSLGFTLDFDATLFEFDSSDAGTDATSATIVINSGTDGKVGVLVILPFNTTFSAGDNHLLDLEFTLATTATAGTSSLSFSSTPVTQQVTEADADIVTGVLYRGATVTLVEGTDEGDVAPRPLGSGSVSVADATQIGLFAAGLQTANNGTEYQRADTAPRSSSGDGSISIADWVQGLRYAAGLDASQPVAGPSQPVLQQNFLSLRSSTMSGRRVTVESDPMVAVRLVLDAVGDENGISCSLQFHPGSLRYVSGSLGAGASGSLLIINSQQAVNGTLGIVLALQPEHSVAAGRQTMVEFEFEVSPNAGAGASITLNGSPVVEEITDASARRLPAVFVGQTFPVELPAGFESAGVVMVGGVPCFTFANVDGSPVTPSQLADLEVFATSDVVSAAWTRLDNALVIVTGKVHIVDPDAGNGIRFYQVRRVASGGGGAVVQ